MMLQNLDLSQNHIGEIRNDSLRNLPWLTYLNLSHNPIERIPDNIQSWYLRQLDLSYCRLSAITNETFRRMPAIEHINLIGNRFTNTFRVEMFSSNEHLYYLQLANNPWICECSQEFKLFWEFLIYFPRKHRDSERADLKCMSPDSVAGKSWIQACYGAWYPYEGPENAFSFTHYGTAIVILLIVAAGIFAVVGIIKRRIKRIIKEEQEARDRENAEIEDHSVAFRLRENSESGNSDSPEVERRVATEGRLTQPPTYEEAMEMFRASREDIVSAEGVEGSSQNEVRPQHVKSNIPERPRTNSAGSDDSAHVLTEGVGDRAQNEVRPQPVKSNIPERSRTYSAGSDDSVDEDNQSHNILNGHSRGYSVGSDDSDEDRGASNPLNRQK
jgi:hypothetical protein